VRPGITVKTVDFDSGWLWEYIPTDGYNH
jgi:hypothetical protein